MDFPANFNQVPIASLAVLLYNKIIRERTNTADRDRKGVKSMSLQECYATFGGDYEGVIGRLRSEKMVKKFAIKFLSDSSYELLLKSMDEKNYEEAFRASHTIKGICQNLGFTKLGNSSSVLTDKLRDGGSEEADALLTQVKEDYQQTVEALQALEVEG